MDYYLLRDGEQVGPYAEDAVRASLQEGAIQLQDYAWCEGADDWKPVGELLGIPAGEPASARQLAFLAFMGVTPPPGVSRQEAALLVNDAMEKDPGRLARWNEERLQLHPDLFAEEIQARKESRPQRFLDHCQREGAAWFAKVAKAHCQVLVGHLDVDVPGWDTPETEAAAKHFFPALAKKFPQLLTPEGREHFQAAGKQSPQSATTALARSATTNRAAAVFRGVIYGALILGGLWIGREKIERLIPGGITVKAPAPAPVVVKTSLPPQTTEPAVASTAEP